MAASTAKFRFVGVEHAAIIKVTGTAPSEALTEFDLHFINNVGFDTVTNEVDFEGDNQTVRRVFLNGITVTIACDTYDLAAVSNAFDKDEVTTIAGITGRTYFGDSDETAGTTCGFVAQVRAENLTSGLNETVRLTVPRGRLQVITPPALAYNAKGVLTLNYTGEKTDADLLGDPLEDAPAGGIFWFLDRMDPVA